MGDSDSTANAPNFNGFLKIEGRSEKLTCHAGLVLLREMDERLGLTTTLQYWSRKLRDQDEGANDISPRGAFVRIDLEDDGDNAVEVILKGDVRLRVRPGFSEDTVRKLVELLRC